MSFSPFFVIKIVTAWSALAAVRFDPGDNLPAPPTDRALPELKLIFHTLERVARLFHARQATAPSLPTLQQAL